MPRFVNDLRGICYAQADAEADADDGSKAFGKLSSRYGLCESESAGPISASGATGMTIMDQDRAHHEEQIHFHVNLADRWERQYVARRLGVSEEALIATSQSTQPTVEELFDSYCPIPRPTCSHY